MKMTVTGSIAIENKKGKALNLSLTIVDGSLPYANLLLRDVKSLAVASD